MKPETIPIAAIYIPRALAREPVDAAKVEELAQSIADEGLRMPILVRPDVNRYVLVSGRHRLEACKALGEKTITVLVVQARKF